MEIAHQMLFASDAALLGVAGLACLLLSALAWLGQVRRQRRHDLDAVGLVPWTGLSLLFFAIGALALLLSGIGLIKG